MIQVIEMNREIKCKNPTMEKMVSAGFCLVPVSPPLLKSPDWFCHMNLRSSPGFCILET